MAASNRAGICLLLLGIGLTGCTQPTPVEPAANPQSPAIIDRLGRRVEVSPPALRIVSLSPATTELLFALDLGDAIVGATKNCNYPEAALAIPRVGGGTSEGISLEAIVAAEPDLVLCKDDSHQPIIESLDLLKIRSMAIGPQSLDELFREAEWIGKITGHERQAAELTASMKKRRERLARVAAAHRPAQPLKVFYEVWDDPLMTAGPGAFIDELLTLAGLENIIQETAVRYPRISAEVVLQADPDLIFAPTTHFKNVDVEQIRSRPGWEGVAAVKTGRIYLISGDEVSRCGPRELDALAEMIRAAYPEVEAAEVGR